MHLTSEQKIIVLFTPCVPLKTCNCSLENNLDQELHACIANVSFMIRINHFSYVICKHPIMTYNGALTLRKIFNKTI